MVRKRRAVRGGIRQAYGQRRDFRRMNAVQIPYPGRSARVNSPLLIEKKLIIRVIPDARRVFTSDFRLTSILISGRFAAFDLTKKAIRRSRSPGNWVAFAAP
jgi:hypothetical protein